MTDQKAREKVWARQQVWDQRQAAARSRPAGTTSGATTPSKHSGPARSSERDVAKAAVAKAAPKPGFRNRPSASLPKRLGIGRIDDSGAGLGKKGKTAFAVAYRSGEISQSFRVCQNGSVPKCVFKATAADVPLDHVLPLCFAGLVEQCHPLALLARRGTVMLLEEHPRGAEEVPPLLPRLVPLLRAALADKERDVVNAAMDVVAPLAAVAGPSLGPFLDRLLPPLARKAAGGPLARKALDALRAVEDAVPDSAAKIKAKVPAY